MSAGVSFHVGGDHRCHVAEPTAFDTIPRVDDPGQQSLALDVSPIVRRRIVHHARQPLAALDWVPLGKLWLIEHVREARACYESISRLAAAHDDAAGRLMLQRVVAHLATAYSHMQARVINLGRPAHESLTDQEWVRRSTILRAHTEPAASAPTGGAT